MRTNHKRKNSRITIIGDIGNTKEQYLERVYLYDIKKTKKLIRAPISAVCRMGPGSIYFKVFDLLLSLYLKSSFMKTKTLSVLLLLVFACKPSNTGLYEIDPPSFQDNPITLSDIADDIRYVPLENSPYLSNIMEVKIEDTLMVISSQSKSDGGIYVYNRQGLLISKIEGIAGNGPGECIYCTDFTINDTEDRIYIVDDMKEELEVYSMKGKYIRTILLGNRIKGFPSDIVFWNSKLVLGYSGSKEYNWAIIDTLGNLTDKKPNTLFPYDCNVGLMGGFYKYKNKINFWDPFSDTIYTISSDWRYQPAYLLKRGENWVPPWVKDVSIMISLCKVHDIFETKNYIYILYGYQKKVKIALINKKDKKEYLSSENGVSNTLDGGLNLTECMTYFTENDREYLVGLIFPHELKAHVAGEEFKNSTPKYSEKKKELEQLANNLNENDNPVLMLVKLKK
ncbi:MAG: 6-bladed beta-propeller [Mangrovibacterium sp.]